MSNITKAVIFKIWFLLSLSKMPCEHVFIHVAFILNYIFLSINFSSLGNNRQQLDESHYI